MRDLGRGTHAGEPERYVQLRARDREERTLTLARDRFGEKPLYFGWQKNAFLFGSELKALCRHPAFVGGLDRDSLAAFLRLGYIPAPHSIYQDVNKLQAGHFITVSSPKQAVSPKAYWNNKAVVEAKHGSVSRIVR